jgi:hypothetical protein
VGTAISLSGISVTPSTANQTIAWSWSPSGNASLSGTNLTPSATGTLTLTAKVVNGSGGGTDYTYDYSISIVNTYTVNYDTNGGTPTSITAKTGVLWGDNNLLPASLPTKAGYTLSWDVSVGGTGTGVTNSSAFSGLATSDAVAFITLQAQWTAKTYTVDYDTNGGTPSSITAKTGVQWGNTNLLPASLPTMTGYALSWNVSAGGTGTGVTNSSAFSSLATNNTVASITLQAQWTPITYTVAYNVNGFSELSAPSSHTGVQYGTNITIAAALSRGDFTFVKWNTLANGSGTDYTAGVSANNLSAAQGATVTLYAQWDFDYDLGDTGPRGGIVFYRTKSGFNLLDNDGTSKRCYYMEAAASDASMSWAQSPYTTTSSGIAVSGVIGGGKRNTQRLLAVDSTKFPAAAYCDSYDGGTNGWFLPNIAELAPFATSGFCTSAGSGAWTSEEHPSNANNSWTVDLPNSPNTTGNSTGYSKNLPAMCRPVRAF